MKITLLQAQPSDLTEMLQLFQNSVMEVCTAEYTLPQRQVWASRAHDQKRWLGILEQQYVCLARLGDHLVGFSSLGPQGYLDLLYVHKDFQRQGIARQLYLAIEAKALIQANDYIYSAVSKTALGFFLKQGFKVESEQENVLEGLVLKNYRMSKKLGI